MVSLTVQIDERLAEVVRSLAAAYNRSESEIVQEALAAFAKVKRRSPQGMGKYHSGRADVSQQTEEILRDAARQ